MHTALPAMPDRLDAGVFVVRQAPVVVKVWRVEAGIVVAQGDTVDRVQRADDARSRFYYLSGTDEVDARTARWIGATG